MRRKYVTWALVGSLVGMFGLWLVPAWAATGPQLGKSFEATPVSGKVLVTVPGGHATTLTHARLVPVKSTFDATHGIVRLSATNGKGIYSGQFTKGGFQALQSTTNPATLIKLVGGCGAAIARHRAYVYRALQVTAPPDFLVIGKNGQAQATVGTAKFTLSDACSAGILASTNQPAGATKVGDQSGQVLASSRNGRVQRTIHAGAIDQLLCSSRAGGSCVGVDLETKGILHSFFFPGVATGKSARTFKFCLSTPVKHSCSPVASNQPLFEHGHRFPGGSAVLICQATRKGNYSASWQLNGVALGSPLKFHVSSNTPGLPCYGLEGNIDANPLLVRLPANIKAVSRVSLPFSAFVWNMSVSLTPTGAPGSERVQGVIYADKGGAPGKLLGVTKPSPPFTANSPANNSYTLNFPAVKGCAAFCYKLTAGTYWIGVISGGTNNVLSIGADIWKGSGAANANAFSQGPSNPFGPFNASSAAANLYLAVNFNYIPVP